MSLGVCQSMGESQRKGGHLPFRLDMLSMSLRGYAAKIPWAAPIPRKTAASSDIFLFHILTFQTKTNSKNLRRRTLLKVFF